MPQLSLVSRLTYFSRFVLKRCLSTDAQNYEVALQKLNSLQSNAATIALSQNQGPLSHVQQSTKVEDTAKYLSRVGVSVDVLDKLSIVHITGTKGKGTTAALCESILRHHGYRTGLFTSPHLVEARERIRLNGVPLPRKQFAENVNMIYNRLMNTRDNDRDMPAYFKFLTVMAFNVFLRENIDVAIIEVGIGGEYDCTNCIRKPAVVGISALGLDHTNILGSSMSDIAWQKSGIMKPGAVGFTVPQTSPSAMDVLRERAVNRKCALAVVPPLESYTWERPLLKPFTNMIEDVYASNASLALQISNAWLKLQSPYENRADWFFKPSGETVPVSRPFHVTMKMAQGLEACSWPGRTQIIPRGDITYFLDGAHTEDSIDYCIKWFLSASCTLSPNPERVRRMLIFNTTGARDSEKFLRMLSVCGFNDAVFSAIVPFPNITDSSDHYSKLSQEKNSSLKCLSSVWQNINQLSNAQIFGSMSEAVDYTKNCNGPCHVLITGSLHLVGCALAVIDPDLSEPVARIPANLRPLQRLYATLQATY